jgi:hypothetical protein
MRPRRLTAARASLSQALKSESDAEFNAITGQHGAGHGRSMAQDEFGPGRHGVVKRPSRFT